MNEHKPEHRAPRSHGPARQPVWASFTQSWSERVDRFRDNGWTALRPKEKIAAAVAVAVTASVLIAPVSILLRESTDGTPQTAPAVSAQFRGGSVVAAARAQSRLFSLDTAVREVGLTQDVDRDVVADLRTSLATSVSAIRKQNGLPPEPEGTAAVLSFQPRGYVIRASTGSVVIVTLWNDVTLDLANGTPPSAWRLSNDFTMVYEVGQWRVQALGATRPGPEPNTDDAERFVPLPGYEGSDG